MNAAIRVAIDGPAGAGKSTTSRSVADELGLRYVDTGALYRSVAAHMIRNGISEKQQDEIRRLLDDFTVTFKTDDAVNHVFVNGREVTGEIRTADVGMIASTVSSYPFVRDALFSMQRAFAEEGGVVMEGRDIGTVIMPDAAYKFFLTASAESRAERRWRELRERGDTDTTLASVILDVKKRDEQDRTRKTAPLKQADDAVLVDNSSLTLEQTVARIVFVVRGGESAHD